jgi:hypothetical protein
MDRLRMKEQAWVAPCPLERGKKFLSLKGLTPTPLKRLLLTSRSSQRPRQHSSRAISKCEAAEKKRGQDLFGSRGDKIKHIQDNLGPAW